MRNKYLTKFLGLVVFLAFLFFPLESQAQVGWALEKVSATFFNGLISWQLNVLGNILAFVMYLFDWLLSVSVGFYDAPVVDAGWGIMRDFANMFFIVALIVMAFATIFEVSKWDFRSMIGRFLVAAVLINFSLALSRMYLKFTDALSQVFLTAIGSAAGQIGQGLNLPAVVPTDAGVLEGLGSFGSFAMVSGVSGIFAIIFTGGMVMAMVTAAAFVFVRIPIIWLILVFAPLAILLNIFPGGAKNFQNWLDKLIGWGAFLPIYLFFVYFGMYFLSRQGEAITAIASGVEIPGGIPFQVAFSYFLVWFFMMGGLKIAMNFSMFTGTGVSKVVGNAPRHLAGTAARWGLKKSGVTRAWEARKQQWKEEGVFLGGRKLLGGDQDVKRREAWLAGKMGVRGQDLKYQQAFVDQAGKSYGDLDTRYRLGQLKEAELKTMAASGDATNPQVYAARKMLAKIGQLDDNISKRTFSELRNNALAQEDFAKTASSAKWSELETENLRAIAQGGVVHKRDSAGNITATYDYTEMGGNANSIGARREAVKSLKDNKKGVAAFDMPEFREYISLLGGPTTFESREFIKTVGNLRPDLIYDLWDSNRTAFKSLNSANLSRTTMITNAVDRADPETLVNMPHSSLWNTADFQTALNNKYQRRRTGGDKARFKAGLIEELAKGVPNAPDKTTIINGLH